MAKFKSKAVPVGTATAITIEEITAWGNARGRVAALLVDRRWHSTSEINHPEVGGSRGVARVWELQGLMVRDPKAGLCSLSIVKKKKSGSTQWLYRMGIQPEADPEMVRKYPLLAGVQY